MSITLVNDTKSLNRLIKSAHTNGAKFAEILHHAGYNCVFHAINTGDIRPLQALYDGLPPAAQLALRVWATKFAPISFATKTNKLAVKKDRSYDAAMLDSVGPMQYKKTVKPAVKHDFNLKDELDKLIAKAMKHNTDGAIVSSMIKVAQAA